MRKFHVGILLMLASPLAFAHAHLESASPATDATVQQSPERITLTFSEALESRLCRITVSNSAGQRVDRGRVTPSDDNAQRISTDLKQLAPGTYTVDWRVTSVDTHHTQGEYEFTVVAPK